MPITAEVKCSSLAMEVMDGLAGSRRKTLSPKYLYDDLGSKLFEAITELPEYGLTKADERVVAASTPTIAYYAGANCLVAELGSGSGKKTSTILQGLRSVHPHYFPIDVSLDALRSCQRALHEIARVVPIHDEYEPGLAKVAGHRSPKEKVLLLFLGSSIGNLDPVDRKQFLRTVRRQLLPGDLFLVGMDLVKDPAQLILGYDDPTGVTAAFNLNLLGRLNRELGADFNLRSFCHRADWNERDRRVEMHLVSKVKQSVRVRDLDVDIHFEGGESILSECSYKFLPEEIAGLARDSGFSVVQTWTDSVWPLAESLWEVNGD